MNLYPFIEAEKAQQRNVKRACELLEVSRAAYYAHRADVPSARQLADEELSEHIRQAHQASKGRAQIVRSIDEPQLGHRDPPQLPDGSALGDEAGEVGRRRLQPVGGQPLLEGSFGLALEVGVPHGGGRQDQARHGDTIAFAFGDREAERRHASPRPACRMVELATCPGSSSSWSGPPSPKRKLGPSSAASIATTDHRLLWSWWRRRHQARARACHSRRQANRP